MLFTIKGIIDTCDKDYDVADLVDFVLDLIEQNGDFEFTGTITKYTENEEEWYEIYCR